MTSTANGPDRELSETESETLARYLSGALDPPQRRAFDERLLRDPALAREFYRQQGLAEAMASAARARAATGSRDRSGKALPRFRHGPALLAAAAVVVVAGVLMLAGPRRERMRGDVGGVRLLAPLGSVATVPAEFRWSLDARAHQYRFELFDAAGNRVHAILTPDTVVRAAPETGTAEFPAAGSWKVVPLTAAGEELPAPAPATYRTR